MSRNGVDARALVTMGLEVGWDTAEDDYRSGGTFACGAVLELVRGIDKEIPGGGLLEVLASLQWAAESAADTHPDVDALKRFAAHIAAARKEVT